jgi:ABC-type branched-subunit amino acid transport system substrate-binding protein
MSLKLAKTILLAILLPAICTAGCSKPPKAPPIQAELKQPLPQAPQEPLLKEEQSRIFEKKVALLLPLSGNKELSDKVLKAAQLALFNTNNKNITLITKDTGTNATSAKMALNQALHEGAELVIGPIYSDTTLALKGTTEARINIISISNNASLAGNGVFILGYSPEEQIRRIIDYATKQNIRDYYAILPAGAFGKKISETIQNIGNNDEIIIHKIEYYTPENDVDLCAESIVNSIKTSNHEGPVAIVIPEGGKKLISIASELEKRGIDSNKIKLLGINQWEEEIVANLPILNGAWLTGIDPKMRTEFDRLASDLYGHSLPELAALAYDAVALASSLAIENDFSTTKLLDPSGFKGITGIFRFNNNNIAEHGLAILEVSEGTIKVIEDAPTFFTANAN